jgi:hypothetical protein
MPFALPLLPFVADESDVEVWEVEPVPVEVPEEELLPNPSSPPSRSPTPVRMPPSNPPLDDAELVVEVCEVVEAVLLADAAEDADAA